MVFPSFLAPFAADAFRTGYYNSKPLFISRKGNGGASLLSWRRFTETCGYVKALTLLRCPTADNAT
jgi:hypothetical protein